MVFSENKNKNFFLGETKTCAGLKVTHFQGPRTVENDVRLSAQPMQIYGPSNKGSLFFFILGPLPKINNLCSSLSLLTLLFILDRRRPGLPSLSPFSLSLPPPTPPRTWENPPSEQGPSTTTLLRHRPPSPVQEIRGYLVLGRSLILEEQDPTWNHPRSPSL